MCSGFLATCPDLICLGETVAFVRVFFLSFYKDTQISCVFEIFFIIAASRFWYEFIHAS
jgi:hypothetical protein